MLSNAAKRMVSNTPSLLLDAVNGFDNPISVLNDAVNFIPDVATSLYSGGKYLGSQFGIGRGSAANIPSNADVGRAALKNFHTNILYGSPMPSTMTASFQPSGSKPVYRSCVSGSCK